MCEQVQSQVSLSAPAPNRDATSHPFMLRREAKDVHPSPSGSAEFETQTEVALYSFQNVPDILREKKNRKSTMRRVQLSVSFCHVWHHQQDEQTASRGS